MLDAVKSALNQNYLFLRQQYHHLQALYASPASPSGHVPANTRFVLFGRGRSGTTALVSMLDDLPDVRCENEILHDVVLFPYEHVVGRSALFSTPVYGCKILSYQVRDVQTRLAAPEDVLRDLHHRDGFQIVYLRRKNLLRHALSNIRARKEHFHRKKSDQGSTARALYIDPDQLIDWMEHSESLQAYERKLLEDVPHLSLTYEENIRSPKNHQSTVDQIAEFLGIETAPVESSYEKVAPPSLEDGVANYDELVEHLANTRYERFLD